MWAASKGGVWTYIFNTALFAAISYALGYVTFIIGTIIYKRVLFRYIRKHFLNKTWPQLNRYGLFLIIVAALTPLPWSTVCLLVGSAGYPHQKFLKYALFRIARFAVYGFIIYHTH
jgi:membrane protein DedA with SNARE-associated domain